MDVGAGTVDLSFFQLLANESDEAPLRYYHAAVLDAGSSMLELKSLRFEPSLDRREVLAYKEGTLANPSDKLLQAFDRARREIHNYVGRGVGDAVVATESKLHTDRAMQLRQMRCVKLMFTGGGFCHAPYELAARFFQRARQWNFEAPMTPIPIPDDIEWDKEVTPVPFPRLSVAYGLSFPRYDVDGQKFPSQTAVNPDAPRPTRRPEVQAPTKDEV